MDSNQKIKSIFTICVKNSCHNNHMSQKDDNTVGIHRPLCVGRIEFQTILKSDAETHLSSGSTVTWSRQKGQSYWLVAYAYLKTTNRIFSGIMN
jgi:hypothetical protein